MVIHSYGFRVELILNLRRHFSEVIIQVLDCLFLYFQSSIRLTCSLFVCRSLDLSLLGVRALIDKLPGGGVPLEALK